jgi:hypothetical protein
MKEIAEKLRDLERELKDEKGPFAYFALVREGEAPDRWDLVVSAPWISANRMGRSPHRRAVETKACASGAALHLEGCRSGRGQSLPGSIPHVRLRP